MHFVAILITIFFGSSLFAGEVKPKAKKNTVIIQNLGNYWGYTKEMTGFYMGEAEYILVPVSREASATLKGLKKKSRHECVIEDSTFVAGKINGERRSSYGGTHYVLDINCD